MAISVGDKLDSPATSYTRYDDKDASILYTGNIVNSGGTSFYQTTGTSLQGVGDTSTFTFTGSKIVVGVYCDSGAPFNVTLDGIDRGTYKAYSDSNNMVIVGFVDEALDYGEHTIVLTALSYAEHGGDRQRVIIDYFDVGEPVKVGEHLPEPEYGWKRYDDSDGAVAKRGTWTYYNALAGTYNGGYQYSFDGSLSFKFYGDRVRLIAAIGENSSDSISVTIDSETVSINEQSSSTQVQRLVFEKIFDAVGYHTVTMSNINTAKNYNIDAIDINSWGRLMHPLEVEKVSDLGVGMRIRAHYRAQSGLVGRFSGLGKETGPFISPALGATSDVDGDFYFILTEVGKTRRLLADRNIHTSVPWDTLNRAGLAFGNEIDFTVIPAHTAETSDMGRAFANGYYTGAYAYEPWKAFDYRSKSSVGDLRWAVEGTTGYLGYQFNEPKAIGSYSLMTINDVGVVDWLTSSPRDWAFEGSSDGTNWSVLHEVSGMTNWISRNLYTFHFENSVAYSQYRINVKVNNGGSYITIMEMNMSESTKQKFIIRLPRGNGLNATDLSMSEWDKWVAQSDLGGTITPGDNAVWNWSTIYSLTSAAVTTAAGSRYMRGKSSASTSSAIASNTTSYLGGFRPVLEIIGQGAFIGFLFRFNEGYMKYNGASWELVSQEMPDENTFIDNAHTSISFLDRSTGGASAIDSLPEEFEIVSLTFESELQGRRFNSKTVPPAQIVPPSGDISIQGISHILGFEVDVTSEGSSRILYAVSVDRGATWHSYKSGSFTPLTLDAEGIAANGMTTGELQLIPENKWTEFAGDSDTFRLAYYMEVDSSTDAVMIDELRMNYRMDGGWESPAQGVDYDYHYPTNESLSIQVYSSGDYKVNYYRNQEEVEKPLWEEFDL
jgi:hypothetical protein